MDNPYTFQASRVSNNSHMNRSSSYRVPPATAHPIQPVQWPIVSTFPTNIPPQQAAFRDNHTALTYTKDQMIQRIWSRDPHTGNPVVRQTKGLFNSGSYTDLTTRQKYTHPQMVHLTGKMIQEHIERLRRQVNHVQPFQAAQEQQQFRQSMQSQMQPSTQPSSVGYPPRGYTDEQAIQLQQRQGVRDQPFVEQHARTVQQSQTQQSLPQQQAYPPIRPSSHVVEAGQPAFIDKFGRQWTRQQYEELIRRQQAQKAQASAAMSSGLGPQFQQDPQTSSPMMMNSQNCEYTHNVHNEAASQNHLDLLRRQKGNMGPSPVPANPGTHQQRQCMPSPGTKSSQQSSITDQSGRQWTREQWEKVEKSRELKKNLVLPSQATKACVPGTPTTEPAVHKQSVSKIQKQPSRQPAASAAHFKKPSVTQPAKQAVPREVKVIGKDVTNESLNPTADPTSLLPVPEINQPNQVSMSKQPNVAPNTAPAPNPPRISTQPTTVSQWDVENGRHIYDSMASFIFSHQEAYHEGLSKLEAAAINPAVNPPPTVSPLAHFDPTIFKKVKHPQYTGFSVFSELNGGVLAEIDNQALLKRICTVDPDGVLRAPEPRWVSEERAKLEWEIRMVGGKYGRGM